MLHRISLDRKGRAYFLRTRELIPELLNRFSDAGIRATWATVGLLMARDKQEMIACLPDVRPVYRDPRLDPYRLIEAGEVGRHEKEDPFHYANSLLELIRETPGQEIGTHTFSHYYCQEDGVGERAFRADLEAAQAMAERRIGKRVRSLVFPRNQVHEPYRAVWESAGIKAWRTNPDRWFWRGDHRQRQRLAARGTRLLDHYLPGPPSSVRMFRPFSPQIDRWSGPDWKVRRIQGEMRRAAREGLVYHLWWHPHNMATHARQNLQALDRILQEYRHLRDTYGLESRAMGEE